MAVRPTDAGSLAEAVYAQIEPLQNAEEDNNYALLIFLGALGQMLQDLDYLAHAPDADSPVWFNLLDLDAIPDAALPWLGQFVGIRVNTAFTAAAQRQQIRNHQTWTRGSIAAIQAAIRPTLTGTQTITITERFGGNAYAIKVQTATTETPVPAATLAAIIAAKPAGLVLTFVVGTLTLTGLTYGDLYNANITYGQLAAEYETYGDLH